MPELNSSAARLLYLIENKCGFITNANIKYIIESFASIVSVIQYVQSLPWHPCLPFLFVVGSAEPQTDMLYLLSHYLNNLQLQYTT